MIRRWIVVIVALLGLQGAASFPVAGETKDAATTTTAKLDESAQETPEQRDARMKWWREARFGMFIHWGVYSVPAGFYKDKPIGGIGEWIMNRGKIPMSEYRAFAKEFNPVKYDPAAWMALAKEAGMKYVVITSKHHDGFAMYDTAVSDWSIVKASPYKKDVIAPLAEAARKEGLRFGLYYSQAQDWNHKGGAGNGWDPAHKGDYDEYLKNIAVPQVKEILTKFKPSVLWWDTPFNMNKERAALFTPLMALSPGIITNDRLGGGVKGDLKTPEQTIPAMGLDYDWESCMTMNDTWGFKKDDNRWKSVSTIIRNLCDIASKGGNYLLNVGPTSEGEIPAASVERLKEVGKWMKVNGEAIYATSSSPFNKIAWGRCTQKTENGKTVLYLIVFDWPKDGVLPVNGLKSKIEKAALLGGGDVDVATQGSWPALKVPAQAPDAIASVIKVSLAGPAEVDQLIPQQAEDGSLTLKPESADIHNRGYAGSAEIAGSGDSRYIAHIPQSTWLAWDTLINKAGNFEVVVEAAAAKAGSKYEVESGKSKFQGAVPDTGSTETFKTTSLGVLKIDKTGRQQIALRAVKEGWSGVSLRKVVLKPTDKPATAATAESSTSAKPAKPAAPVSQAADGSFVLKAADAALNGKTFKVEGEGTPNIGYWTNASEYPTWTLKVEKPGEFQVELLCASQADGTEVSLSIGDAAVKGKIESTGDWDKYKSQKLGTLKIEKAGTATCTLKALKKSAPGVMNLRSVTLKPAAAN